MADDVTQLALIVGASTLVNVTHAANTKADTVVPLVAGGLTFSALSIVGGLFKDFRLVVGLAWVFLISALVMRGGPLIASGQAVLTSTAARTSPVDSSPSGGSTGNGYSGGGGGGGGGGGR